MNKMPIGFSELQLSLSVLQISGGLRGGAAPVTNRWSSAAAGGDFIFMFVYDLKHFRLHVYVQTNYNF